MLQFSIDIIIAHNSCHPLTLDKNRFMSLLEELQGSIMGQFIDLVTRNHTSSVTLEMFVVCNIGDRPAVICREISKKYEEIFRGTVSELLLQFNSKKTKGEFVIMIAKDDKNVYF